MNTRLTFIVLGRWNLGLSALMAMEGLGEVKAVVSTSSYQNDNESIVMWDYAQSKKIKCIDFNQKKWREEFQQLTCDFLISCAFSKILKKEELKVGTKGAINIHPALLPKHRGPSPIQAAILSGDSHIGLTAILMDEWVDHGPILKQKSWNLDPQKTPRQLVEQMISTMPSFMNDVLQCIHSLSKGEVQNNSFSTFAPRVIIPWDETVAHIRKNYEKI